MNKFRFKTDSEREQEVIEHISTFRDIYGYSPSYSQLAQLIGVSKSRIAQIVEVLIIKKLVTKDGNKARTLQIV